jgi:hypothetical protein
MTIYGSVSLLSPLSSLIPGTESKLKIIFIAHKLVVHDGSVINRYHHIHDRKNLKYLITRNFIIYRNSTLYIASQ